MASPKTDRWTAQKRLTGPEAGPWETTLDCESAPDAFSRAGDDFCLGVDVRVLLNGEEVVVFRVETRTIPELAGDEPDFPMDEP